MITIIAAASLNNVIGNDEKIPWHLPNDFKMFKVFTSGNPIIMGRKTFDSLPGILPNRKHIVITRTTDLSTLKSHPEVQYVNSLEEAFEVTSALKMGTNVYVIGGGEIFEQSLKYAKRVLLTKVNVECEGDAFFPELLETEWKLIDNIENKADEKHAYNYNFLTYLSI